MAGIFVDSFDHLAWGDITEKWTQVTVDGGGLDSSTIGAYGRHGTNGLRLRIDGIVGTSKSLLLVPDAPPPSGATWICGFAFNAHTGFANLHTPVSDSVGPCLVRVRKDSTTQMWFRLNTNGTISAFRGTTLLGTTAQALHADIYHYLAFKVLIHPSAGTVTITIDGIPALALTGQNTQVALTATWDEFGIGPACAFTGVVEWYYDDLYVLDGSGSAHTDLLGDVQVGALLPIGAGASSGWTRSTGANQWATIDEVPPNDDTDYNAATTAGLTDTLTFADIALDPLLVQVNLTARKTDPGTATVAAIARVGGVNYPGSDRGPATVYLDQRQIYDRNPSDGSAWTIASVNAAEFGYRKTA